MASFLTMTMTATTSMMLATSTTSFGLFANNTAIIASKKDQDNNRRRRRFAFKPTVDTDQCRINRQVIAKKLRTDERTKKINARRRGLNNNANVTTKIITKIITSLPVVADDNDNDTKKTKTTVTATTDNDSQQQQQQQQLHYCQIDFSAYPDYSHSGDSYPSYGSDNDDDDDDDDNCCSLNSYDIMDENKYPWEYLNDDDDDEDKKKRKSGEYNPINEIALNIPNKRRKIGAAVVSVEASSISMDWFKQQPKKTQEEPSSSSSVVSSSPPTMIVVWN